MYCKRCGKQFSDTARFCPACGTEASGSNERGNPTLYTPSSTPTSEEQPQGMKWFKFVIYVQLFLSALLSLGTAIMYATGYQYTSAQSSPDLIYGIFPELHTVDASFAVVYVALAIIAIAVRFRLSGYKRNAWKGYLAYLAAGVIAVIAYIIAASTIVGESMFDMSMTSSLAANIVLIIVNFIYFNKRDHLFVN